MSFAHSWIWWFLIALAIPILVHLFNFRQYKKVAFTNVAFLKNILQQTQKQSTIKHRLLLACRLLSFLFLIMAFAQPFIKKNAEQVDKGQAAVSIYIDNSMSMQANTSDLSLLNKAKTKAKEVLEAYNDATKFEIITNDINAKAHFFLNKQDAVAVIDAVDYSYAQKNTKEIVNLAKSTFTNAQANYHHLYLIGDYQKKTTEFSVLKDSSVTFFLVHIHSAQQVNVSIDSAWLYAPSQTLNEVVKIAVSTHNYSENKQTTQLNLLVNGAVRSAKEITLEPNTSKIDSLTFVNNQVGWQSCKISINESSIPFDNDYFLTYYVKEKLKLLSILPQANSNKYINALFKNESNFQITQNSVQNINFSALKNNDAIIINALSGLSSGLQQALSNYIAQGGNIIIFPNTENNLAVNEWLKSFQITGFGALTASDKSIGNINVKSEWWRSVFTQNKPFNNDIQVKKYTPIQTGSIPYEGILTFTDGSAFIRRYRIKKGNLFLVASPLHDDCSNFGGSALFVPLVYNISAHSSFASNSNMLIGKTNAIAVSNAGAQPEQTVQIKSDKTKSITTVYQNGMESSIALKNTITEPNIYDVLQNEKLLLRIGANIQRNESDLSCYTMNDLKKIAAKNIRILDGNTSNMKSSIIAESKGFQLWKWCLLFALFFLLLESLIIRFYK